MQPVTHRPGQPGIVTVWQDGQPTQLELPWGLRPVEPHGRPVSLLRWEGRAITRPGLLVVDSFALRIDGKDKYRVRIPGHDQFCIACVWQPAGRDWPAAYAALTTEAYPDIAPYKDRHMAVVREDDWILVHDAARPCLSPQLLNHLLDTLHADTVGGLLAVPLADTLKRAGTEQRVAVTESRENLWQAQTPQMFRYALLVRALQASGDQPTDEAQAVEALGYKPRLVPGELRNLKITYPHDLALAEAILNADRALAKETS